MKLFKSLLIPVLFAAVLSFTGCNEEPISTENTTNVPTLSKLTLPAGAVVTSATFNVFSIQNQSTTVNVHKVLVPWVEATETYNTFFAKPSPQWNAAIEGSFDASAVGWHSADVTALVQSWIANPATNYGLLLDHASYPNCPDPLDQKFIQYHSRENVNVPYLEVTYTLNGNSTTVQEAVFGDTYLHSADPDFPRGAVDVLFQTRWDDPTCSLLKLPLFIFDIEQEPQMNCETAYAFGDTPFCGLPNISNWGWTEYINGNYTNTNIPIYAGAAQCDPNNGTQVGTLSITYVGTSLTVNYTMNSGVIVENVHMWIGDTQLPIKNGKLTSAPGQFNYNNQTFPFNLTKSNPFYIAVH
jgi:hypothetical protein